MAKKIVLTEAVLIGIGVAMAEAFCKAEANASKIARDVIMSAALTHAGDVTNSKAVLKGYQDGFINLGMSEGTAKTRKAEANAVFEAVAMTEVSEANIKKLEEFEGSYHAFITLARELRGVKQRSSGTRNSNKSKLTDSQYDKVETALDKADPIQLGYIAEQSLVNLHKKAPASLAGFQSLILMQQAANSLIKSPDVEEFFKRIGEEVLTIVEPAIAQVKEAQAKSQEVAAIGQGNAAMATETKEIAPEGEALAA